MTKNIHIAALSLVALFSLCVNSAHADPLSGQQLKFLQSPLNGGIPSVLQPGVVAPGVAPFPGRDNLSTAWATPPNGTPFNYQGNYMADDFADNVSTPVVHVQWWGSYMNNTTPGSISSFLISFENDIPATPGNPSHPGLNHFSQVVTAGALSPGSGTYTEKAITTAPGSPDGTLFQYNAELALPFNETKDTVYWLKIVALDPNHAETDPTRLEWGWHNRDWGVQNLLASPVPVPGEFLQGPASFPMWHFQDDAVTGRVQIGANTLPSTNVLQTGYFPTDYLAPYDLPVGLNFNYSQDLAFALYTTPEPSSVLLMGFGGLALLLHVMRKRNAR